MALDLVICVTSTIVFGIHEADNKWGSYTLSLDFFFSKIYRTHQVFQ